MSSSIAVLMTAALFAPCEKAPVTDGVIADGECALRGIRATGWYGVLFGRRRQPPHSLAGQGAD